MCFGQHWPSSVFSSKRFVCFKIGYLKHAAMYQCQDLIIEDFELNMAYSLCMEPSDMGSGQVGGGGVLHCRLVSSLFQL